MKKITAWDSIKEVDILDENGDEIIINELTGDGSDGNNYVNKYVCINFGLNAKGKPILSKPQLKLQPEPEQVLGLEIIVDKTQAAVNEVISYKGVFDQAITLNQIVPLSVINRDGKHVKNIGITITNGVAEGTISFDKSGDFLITNRAINVRKDNIGTRIVLSEEILFRIYE